MRLTLILLAITLIARVSAVYIAAVEPNPDGKDAYREWVAIYNPDDQPVYIGGWYVYDESDEKVFCKIPDGIYICPHSFYRCYEAGEIHAALLMNAKPGDNITLYDSNGVAIDSAYNLSDPYDDERIWWRPDATSDLVFGYYADLASVNVEMSGKTWSTSLRSFYDSTLTLRIHSCYRRGVEGVEDIVGVAEISVNGETLAWDFNGTIVHYDVHLAGGEDVGFIPPYMLTEIASGKKAELVQKYYLNVPVAGIQLSGWRIGGYWLLSGVAVREEGGGLFNSSEFYVLYFRNGGDFGLPPSGGDYLNLTKRLIYFRTKIIEDVWRSMESTGLWNVFWDAMSRYMSAYIDIWSAVRSRLVPYVP